MNIEVRLEVNEWKETKAKKMKDQERACPI